MNSIFGNFFSLGFNLIIAWQWFLILFVAFAVFFLGILTILLVKKLNVPPLDLINGTDTQKNSKVKEHANQNRSFTRKIAGSMLRQSWVKLTLFSVLFLVSTAVMVVSSIFAIYFINYSNYKYYSYNYSAKTQYNNLTVENPFSKVATYDWTLPEEEMQNGYNQEQQLLPASINGQDLKTYLNNWTPNENDSTASKVSLIEKLLFQSIEAGYKKNISLSYFDYIANQLVGYYANNIKPYRDISEFLSLLLAEMLPKAIGMKSVNYEQYPTAETRGTKDLRTAYLDVWEGILSTITEQKLNDEAKVAFTSNVKYIDQFTFSFSTTPLVANGAAPYTYVTGSAGKAKNMQLIGQMRNGKYGLKTDQLLKLNRLNTNNTDASKLYVVASQKWLTDNKDVLTVDMNYNVNQLQFMGASENEWYSFSDINNDGDAQWYYYDEKDQLQNLYDATNRSFFAGDTYNDELYDNNGQRYLNVNDIVIKISKDKIDKLKDAWTAKAKEVDGYKVDQQGHDFLTNETVVPTTVIPDEANPAAHKLIEQDAIDSNYYLIHHAYSYRYSGDTDSQVDFTQFSKTWYDIATAAGLIKTNPVTKKVTLQIVDSFKNYDSDTFIADQMSLNKLLGVATDDSWFNGLFSNENIPTDVQWNYGLVNNDGNISISAVQNYSKKTGTTDYIGFQKTIMFRWFKIALQIGIIIYVLLFVALLVSLSFIIKMFVYQFKQFILVLRAMGYTFKTINLIILLQLIPFALLGWAIGFGATLGAVDGIAGTMSAHLGNTIPLGTGISLLPITLGILVFLFAGSYIVILQGIRRIHVSAITED